MERCSLTAVEAFGLRPIYRCHGVVILPDRLRFPPEEVRLELGE